MKPGVADRVLIDGPAGRLEATVARPSQPLRGLAVIAHPHPLFGGTMDNKVVQTLARAFLALDHVVWRVNFRGVGASDGAYDEGRGEIDDFIALIEYARAETPALPLAIAGFSFGGYVAAQSAAALQPQRLVLVAPAVGRFAVPAVPAHTLVVHGEDDDVVPLREVLDWARPAKLPIVVIPGAGHFFHGDLMLLQQLVLNARVARE